MKRNSRIYFLLIALGIILYSIYMFQNKSQLNRIESNWDLDNTREIYENDKVLAKSKIEVQKHLPKFFSLFKLKRTNHHEFFAKVKFIEEDNVEHMWVEVIDLGENQSLGILDNDPLNFRRLKYGDTVKFDLKEIEDLMIYRNDSLILGGFIQAELSRN